MQAGSCHIMIGGEAGQGLATVGELLAKSLVRSGYFISVYQSYMSRIRGGHNWFSIRTGPKPVAAPIDDVDILVALNQETVDLHKGQVVDGGVILVGESFSENEGAVAVPYKELAPKPIFENVAALGVLASLLGLSEEVPEGLLKGVFKKKGDEIINQNLKVLSDSFSWSKEQGFAFQPLPAAENGKKRLMMTGNEAIAIGALAAGADYCSFYPMTPSTSVALNLINKGMQMGFVAEQAEDEIAAVNMALGASFAGARVIVPTSGGGMALMTEGVSLAGITETPIVFALAMRPGPATGLPTRSEQGDLNLVLYAGHGEFPRAIYAPGTVEDFFHLTYTAFDTAEKFQIPVFMLTDQFMADSFRAVEPFDLTNLPEVASPCLEGCDPKQYKRYEVTDSGVSKRCIPGYGEQFVIVDSDEHDEEGHITEDLALRNTMHEKRLRKVCGMLEEVIAPDFFGDDAPDTLFVCWGSTLGAAVEAADMLREQGKKAATLHFKQLWPLKPEQFMPFLEAAKETVCVEGNAGAQFGRLIRRQTGHHFEKVVLRYDGLPFTAQFILDNMKGNVDPVACSL